MLHRTVCRIGTETEARTTGRRFSRRGVLQGALAAGFAPPATGPMERPARVPQQEARYQDRPKDGFSCAACALFRPPAACTVVEGHISPRGWCRFFDLPD